jgi:flagellar basal-body rod protein FlgB
MTDITTAAVEYALRGLQQRADVRAHNMANVNTPNFRGSRVDFENSLRSALSQRDPGPIAAPAVLPTASLPNAAGTTVDLETEMVGMMQDNLLRDAMVNAFNFKTGVLRTAITGGR